MKCVDIDWISDTPCTCDAMYVLTSDVGVLRGPFELCEYHARVYSAMLARFYPTASVTVTPVNPETISYDEKAQ